MKLFWEPFWYERSHFYESLHKEILLFVRKWSDSTAYIDAPLIKSTMWTFLWARWSTYWIVFADLSISDRHIVSFWESRCCKKVKKLGTFPEEISSILMIFLVACCQQTIGTRTLTPPDQKFNWLFRVICPQSENASETSKITNKYAK